MVNSGLTGAFSCLLTASLAGGQCIAAADHNELRRILDKHCVACHAADENKQAAKLDLSDWESFTDEYNRTEFIARVAIDMDADMPPTKWKKRYESKYGVSEEQFKEFQISLEDRKKLVDWVKSGAGLPKP